MNRGQEGRRLAQSHPYIKHTFTNAKSGPKTKSPCVQDWCFQHETIEAEAYPTKGTGNVLTFRVEKHDSFLMFFAHVCFSEIACRPFCELQVWSLTCDAAPCRSYGTASKVHHNGRSPAQPPCGSLSRSFHFCFLNQCVSLWACPCACLFGFVCIAACAFDTAWTTVQFLPMICICAGSTKARDVGESHWTWRRKKW